MLSTATGALVNPQRPLAAMAAVTAAEEPSDERENVWLRAGSGRESFIAPAPAPVQADGHPMGRKQKTRQRIFSIGLCLLAANMVGACEHCWEDTTQHQGREVF